MIPWNNVGNYVVDCPNGFDEFYSNTTENPTQATEVPNHMEVTQDPTMIMTGHPGCQEDGLQGNGAGVWLHQRSSCHLHHWVCGELGLQETHCAQSQVPAIAGMLHWPSLQAIITISAGVLKC